jgi:hypothetical protein
MPLEGIRLPARLLSPESRAALAYSDYDCPWTELIFGPRTQPRIPGPLRTGKGGSGDLPPPSPPAEKASARARSEGDIVERVRLGVAYEGIPIARDVARVQSGRR